MRPLSPVQVRARLKLLSDCADEFLGTAQAAKRLGVSRQAVSRFLGRYDTELRARLSSNSTHGAHIRVSPAEALRRLRTVVEAEDANESLGSAARRLGITTSALWEWLKDNAPDGARDALSDYIDDETDEAYV